MRDKILIIKLGALGDLVISTPFIEAIKEKHKQDKIVILTRKKYAFFFKNHKNISLMTINDPTLKTSLSIVIELRRTLWSKIYDLQGNNRSRALTFFSRANCKIGNHKFPNTIYPSEKWKKQIHIFYRMKTLLEEVGLKNIKEKPVVTYNKIELEKVKQWINKKVGSQKFVILHAGSSHRRKDKRWPFFKGLAKKLEKIGYKTLWIGGSEDQEINRLMSKNIGIDATNAFNIHELACLGNFAQFAVTNDSAPMHVLSSCNIPVIGLFGPTDKKLHHAIGNLPLAISTKKSDENMATISIAEVMGKLQRENLI